MAGKKLERKLKEYFAKLEAEKNDAKRTNKGNKGHSK